MIKIAITGPESTGKTSLALGLAQYFSGKIIPEFSRIYLKGKDAYFVEDVLYMAQEQYKLEKEKRSEHLVIADTELLVYKIWLWEKYQFCPDWIHSAIQESDFDFYFLCAADLPWEEDPLRENPYDRERLFHLYEEELKNYNKKYQIVKGEGEERIKPAISIIEHFLL